MTQLLSSPHAVSLSPRSPPPAHSFPLPEVRALLRAVLEERVHGAAYSPELARELADAIKARLKGG